MNPLAAPHIRRYPVIPENGVISEVWHARKWRHDVDRHILSPMYDTGYNVHYFIDEPAMLSNKKMIIPIRWLEDEKGGIWADAWEIEYDEITVGLPILILAGDADFPVDAERFFPCRSFQQSEMTTLS